MFYIWVAVGGILGAVSRSFICRVLADKSLNFPYSTLSVNIIGCFLMGIFIEFFALKAQMPLGIKVLLTSGFLGAFTTFSTFGLDIVMMMNKGAFLNALLYAFLSVILGIFSLYGGLCLVRMFLH